MFSFRGNYDLKSVSYEGGDNKYCAQNYYGKKL